AGVEDVAGEGVDAVDFRLLRLRQAAGRHDAELRRHEVAAVSGDMPAPGACVPRRRRHPRVELDVAAEVEAVCDVVQVPQDLGLGGVALGPRPLLLDLGRERIAVVHRLDVAAGPRIPVPPPRSADAAGGVEAPDREAEGAQPVVRVQAGEAGADDDRVDIGRSSGHDASLPRIYDVTQTRISAPGGPAVSASSPAQKRRAPSPARRTPASRRWISPAATNRCTWAPSGIDDASPGRRRAPHSTASCWWIAIAPSWSRPEAIGRSPPLSSSPLTSRCS